MQRHRKGLASVYFLSILLYCISVTAVICANDMDRMHALIDLERHEALLEEEGMVLSDLKNAWKTGEVEDGTYTSGMISYETRQEGDTVWVDLYGKEAESLQIVIDEESREIMDWKILGNSIEAGDEREP